MKIILMKSKIHRAILTSKNISYEGSVAISEDLIEEAGLFPFEQVDVYNINNGERITTYVIKAERGKGIIELNGAAARKGEVGDLLIIVSYGSFDLEEAKTYKPKIIVLDRNNKIKERI